MPDVSNQRVLKFRVRNPEKVKHQRMKDDVKKSEKRLTDHGFNEEVKQKQREKKRRQRADAAKKRDAPGAIETSSSGITVSSQMISPPTFAPPPGEKMPKHQKLLFLKPPLQLEED